MKHFPHKRPPAALRVIGRLPPGLSAKDAAELASLALYRASRFVAARGPAALARRALRSSAELSLTVVTDARMRRLNRDFRGKDKTTDVLSFGQPEALAPAASGRATAAERRAAAQEPVQLGDLFVSLPQVRRQAKAVDRPVSQEFALMVVHGTLHLLGFDHETLADERRMFGLQHDILSQSGHF